MQQGLNHESDAAAPPQHDNATETQHDTASAPQSAGADATDRMTLTWRRLREIADRFEKAWQEDQAGKTVDPAGFLPEAGDPLRPQALIALIGLDLEIRWKRGQVMSLDPYLDKFPELGSVATLSPKLIYEEYRVRHLYGDKPPLDKYRLRFPNQFMSLQKLLAEQPIASPFCTPTLASPSGAGGASTYTGPQQTVLPIGGGYRLLRRIGAGSYGEVWRAEHAISGIEAAIKIITRPMDQAEAQTELQAAETVKRLRHSFLLQNIHFESLEDRLVIIMELADVSLRERMKQCAKETGQGIPRDELIGYMKEAADALDYLHSENVHHRDIKPENILLLKKHVKVADFGLARVLEGQRSLMSMSVSGTPAYMAPEVWNGKFSPHSDQYSLAVSYAELRLNRRLYPGKAYAELMRFHTENAPDLAPLPEAEQRVLLKALAKNPNERYPSCLAFAEALERAARADAGVIGVGAAEGSLVEALDTSNLGRSSGALIGPPRARWRVRAAVFAGVLVPLALAGFLVRSATTKKPANEVPAVVATPGTPQPTPPGFTAVGEETAKDITGRIYYKEIVKPFRDGIKAEFVLVPQMERKLRPNQDDVPTFYMMKNKVSQGLFRIFAEEHPELVPSAAWDAGKKMDEYPVYNVSTDEACSFAKWLHGRLPKKIQWFKASGMFLPSDLRGASEGPYRGEWRKTPQPSIAVGQRRSPMKAGAAEDDESPFYHCRDMAGNGLEWTREFTRSTQEAPIPDYNPERVGMLRVYLIGRRYTDFDPLTFRELEMLFAGTEDLGAWDYNDRKDETGFRVVIEPEVLAGPVSPSTTAP